MIYYGVKVIYFKIIKLFQNKSILLMVKFYINLEGVGIYIFDEVEDNYLLMVVIEGDQVLLQISICDFFFVVEYYIWELFNIIVDLCIQVNMM